MKRVRFTKRELQAIFSMACIADASPAEGDHQDWNEEKFAAAVSAGDKALELLDRMKKVSES